MKLVGPSCTFFSKKLSSSLKDVFILALTFANSLWLLKIKVDKCKKGDIVEKIRMYYGLYYLWVTRESRQKGKFALTKQTTYLELWDRERIFVQLKHTNKSKQNCISSEFNIKNLCKILQQTKRDPTKGLFNVRVIVIRSPLLVTLSGMATQSKNNVNFEKSEFRQSKHSSNLSVDFQHQCLHWIWAFQWKLTCLAGKPSPTPRTN